jgi:hypothetical protein
MCNQNSKLTGITLSWSAIPFTTYNWGVAQFSFWNPNWQFDYSKINLGLLG